MKVIILAAGQGARLRPLTDNLPKCLVEVNGRSILERQLDIMRSCGIEEKDITIIAGYCGEVLQRRFSKTKMAITLNEKYATTNMVYSLMCAKELIEAEEDLLVSYGDIIYNENVLMAVLHSKEECSVVVDDEWLSYWSERSDNPLDDAETLMFDERDYLSEIGQKTEDLRKVQSQYIGLMRFRGEGLRALSALAKEAERRTKNGISLWGTSRNYFKMYMTDLLQGMIEEGNKLKAVHIRRGWFEIDNRNDLELAESKLI